jgi:hypothetical protein
MSTAAQGPRRHPVAATVARLHYELDQVVATPLWTLDEPGTEELLVEATMLRARAAELELRVAAHADRLDVGARHGATSTASWWAHRCLIARSEAHRRVRLARRLQEAHEQVAEALAAGRVAEDQAAVIVAAVDALPADLVDPEVAQQARTYLLTAARDHDAAVLRVLGRRVLDVVAPQVGEAHESRVLEREERDAMAACRFTLTEDGHGRAHGRFTLPTLPAQMLRKALMALAAPKHAGHPPAGSGGRCPSGWGRRSASTSSPTPPTGSRTREGSPPPWWSPSR